MDNIARIIDIVTGSDSATGLILAALLLILSGVELRYWLGPYARIPRYRIPRRENRPEAGGISVVVILNDDFPYLENTLPKLMGQQYPDFEAVVMQVNPTPEFSDELERLKTIYPNLATARIDPDPRFRVTDKMIYNIGIKTARCNNIILTTPDVSPASPRWLDCMANGFANGEVVLGYCGLEIRKGLANKMMRLDRLMFSVRWLSSAIARRPYRGIIQNLGFTKSIYLDNRGFNHLDMNIGADDLFIQKIATGDNTNVVMNPHATLRQEWSGGLHAWWRQRKIGGTTRRYYTAAAKRATRNELVVRLLFMLTVIAFAVTMPLYTALGALGIWLVRLLAVHRRMRLICRRLGEKGLGWAIPVFDIAEPFVTFMIFISRRVKPAKVMWQ